ncbi:hypothetical protein [Flavobacterium subsaxonicum]|uniref:Uncharacterized protein n=1 Tax=Flavobacterium subsaxonicum WB 4.1-42 = DSM 21790 TaxID=1121898 RepID=A0A0A2MML6_9FLAO|nr:hypothetical protein [Flavobacterium subsaxonicum]KGO92688.1 hypothetical protein Q766_11240 [Flavobacterium subsaxonicum WB 4.1-42 = DSM 21790]
MEKKINPEQIDQLYTFTRAHFVEYYDLQTELVDHLANAIEATWQLKPNVSFEDALQMEFKKFGVFGFSTVVEQRQKALGKKYYKLLWGYFKQFFKLPLIVVTVALVVLTYKILEVEPLLYLALMGGLVVTMIVKITGYKKRHDKKVKATGKKWLLEDIIYKCGGVGAMLGLPFQFYHMLAKDHVNTGLLWFLSVFFVLVALFSYVVLFVIPAKAEEHLKATYPEYDLEFSK